jgi:hypothetical protein
MAWHGGMNHAPKIYQIYIYIYFYEYIFDLTTFPYVLYNFSMTL